MGKDFEPIGVSDPSDGAAVTVAIGVALSISVGLGEGPQEDVRGQRVKMPRQAEEEGRGQRQKGRRGAEENPLCEDKEPKQRPKG